MSKLKQKLIYRVHANLSRCTIAIFSNKQDAESFFMGLKETPADGVEIMEEVIYCRPSIEKDRLINRIEELRKLDLDRNGYVLDKLKEFIRGENEVS